MNIRKNVGIKISIITIIINIILFIFKLIAGILGHSNAMISDAVHSLTDVLTTFLVIFGLVMASKNADKKHPYGHERIESVCGIILSFCLFLTGLGIGYLGLINIINYKNLQVPGLLSLIAALISILVKEGMFHYTIYYAKKLKSTSLKADAWHHRSDALSSIGAFIGIFFARFGFPILDPVCSLLICLLIVISAIQIFKEAISQMIDISCDEKTNEAILKIIEDTHENVVVKDFKTRIFGSKIYIDALIATDGNMSLKDADKIVTHIHDVVEKKFKEVKHCNIHIIPNE